MAYIAIDDLYTRARKDTVNDWATDDVNGVNPDIFGDAINWAENEIDQALMSRYASSLPFSSVPYAIKNIAVDFAIYWLASRAQAIAETTYLANYKDARARLQRIADGKEPLVTPDGDPISASDSIAPDESESYAYSTTGSWTPIFTRNDATIASRMQR